MKTANAPGQTAALLKPLIEQRKIVQAALEMLNQKIAKLKAASRPPAATSGKRGNQPMPKPRQHQLITATVWQCAGKKTGMYVHRRVGSWKRECFVNSETNETYPWRYVKSWSLLKNQQKH